MNCLTARETLDLICPDRTGCPDEGPLFDTDGNELPGAMIDEAAQHVNSCPTCQIAVRRREQIAMGQQSGFRQAGGAAGELQQRDVCRQHWWTCRMRLDGVGLDFSTPGEVRAGTTGTRAAQ